MYMKEISLSLNHKKVLNLLEKQGQLNTGTVVSSLKIPHPTAKQSLQRLVELGLIDRHGEGRGAHYTMRREDEIIDNKGNKLVTVYRGIDSFKKMFEGIENELLENDYYWSFAFGDEYEDQELREFLLQFHINLGKKNIDDRSIAIPEVKEIIQNTYRNVKTLHIRFTDTRIPTGLIILKDRVITLVWSDHPIAIETRSPSICKRYQDFFLTTWNQALIYELQNKEGITKPGNTPILVPKETIFGVKNLLIKDETKNPTHTFKDRLAYEMIRPLLEDVRRGTIPEPMTFGSISYGNTAKAMGYYVDALNTYAKKEIARAVAFVPPSLYKKTFGPDTEDSLVAANDVIKDLSKTCSIVPIDLSKKIYTERDLEELARENNKVIGQFVDITEGLNRPAYVNIIIETIEQQLRFSPDYVIVPFGAGILCNEVIDYVNEHKLKTKVIPVSSGDPDTIAIMLYGPIWVDTKTLLKDGKAFTRHEDIDRKGRKRDPYIVYHVTDQEITNSMQELKKNDMTAEPSGASGIALLPRLKSIDPMFDQEKHSVLVINTGNGLENFK
jgi:cysteine synthase/predicted transcriptional regulator